MCPHCSVCFCVLPITIQCVSSKPLEVVNEMVSNFILKKISLCCFLSLPLSQADQSSSDTLKCYLCV